MKLCIECKHYRPDTGFYAAARQQKYSMCARKIRLKVDRVSGEAIPADDGRSYCTVQRQAGAIGQLLLGTCGKHGRWWEPK